MVEDVDADLLKGDAAKDFMVPLPILCERGARRSLHRKVALVSLGLVNGVAADITVEVLVAFCRGLLSVEERELIPRR